MTSSSGTPDPKAGRRIIDPEAIRRAQLAAGACVACGAPAGSIHHVVPRGAPYLGDDVPGNLVPLCGSGTTGCHGAVHHGHEVTLHLVGKAIAADPSTLAYVERKLGPTAGRDYLRRRYGVDA